MNSINVEFNANKLNYSLYSKNELFIPSLLFASYYFYLFIITLKLYFLNIPTKYFNLI